MWKDLKRFKIQVERMQEKATGKGSLDANLAVDQDAVAKDSVPLVDLSAGSGADGLLEMSIIAFRFIQNCSLVILIEVSWLLSFEASFQWLGIFYLNFYASGRTQLEIGKRAREILPRMERAPSSTRQGWRI